MTAERLISAYRIQLLFLFTESTQEIKEMARLTPTS